MTSSPTRSAPVAASRLTSARDRLRAFHADTGSAEPRRLVGLDVARALAIIGMIFAHTTAASTIHFSLLNPETWPGVVNGNAATLFAVLGGVSIALMTGRTAIPSPEAMPAIRLRLLGRGATIFLIGLVLEVLNTSVVIILCTWGVLYVAIMPFIRWRRRNLILASAALALLAPPLTAAIPLFLDSPTGPGAMFTLFGVYHVPVWLSLMLAGLALGRTHLAMLRTRALFAAITVPVALAVLAGTSLLLGQSEGASTGSFDPAASSSVTPVDEITPGSTADGTPSALGGEGTGAASDAGTAGTGSSEGTASAGGAGPVDGAAPGDTTAGDVVPGTREPGSSSAPDAGAGAGGSSGGDEPIILDEDSPVFSTWPHVFAAFNGETLKSIAAEAFSPLPHSGSIVEIAASGSLAFAVIALCLVITPLLRSAVLPLAALGSMSLTVYTLHVLAIWVIAGPVGAIVSWKIGAGLSAVLMVTATAWWLWRGRGPLETLVARVATRAESPPKSGLVTGRPLGPSLIHARPARRRATSLAARPTIRK